MKIKTLIHHEPKVEERIVEIKDEIIKPLLVELKRLASGVWHAYKISDGVVVHIKFAWDDITQDDSCRVMGLEVECENKKLQSFIESLLDLAVEVNEDDLSTIYYNQSVRKDMTKMNKEIKAFIKKCTTLEVGYDLAEDELLDALIAKVNQQNLHVPLASWWPAG